MLSLEDKIFIKNLWQCKNYGSKRLIKEFPDKNWKKGTLDNFLRKLKATGSVERTVGSGRPRSSRTEDNITAVEELIQSQEGKSKTHMSTRQISKELNLPRTTQCATFLATCSSFNKILLRRIGLAKQLSI